MKPVLLRLSGLQSYREAQEVDFARLCEAGVFGIFGATGSGKSSILDAVTLALYGKVERAANGTQGIMNQAEKQLSVAFTFELSGAGEKRRYRVERQFKRGGDVSVSSSLSRFVEISDDGDIVIADKLADVTRCVEERIGLNMQDFTRAVVLPQGKFAEFLSLTGKDRRSMLQRLFRLERFGDGLALKLSQRMKAAEAALNQAAAEQHGLGDASAAAVDEAAARHREAEAAAAAARAALAAAERLHAERLHVRERQEALRAKEALQAKLLADAPRMAALERELQRLAAAERLLPALAAAEAAEAALRAAASRREQAGLAHAARLEAATSAAAAWTAASGEAAAAEPRIALRLDQLAQAQRLEGEAAALAASAADGERRYADAAGRQRSFGEQAAKAQETLGRALQRQNELKGELKTAELAAGERERRTTLARRLQHYEGLQSQLEAARREASSHALKLTAAKQALDAAQAERDLSLAALAVRSAAIRPAIHELRQLQSGLRKVADQLPSWIKRARSQQRELQRLQLAAQLAEGLQEGEACPVCGSYDHPLLQDGSALHTEAAELDDAPERLEGVLQQTQTMLMRITPLLARAEAVYERLNDIAGIKEAAQHVTEAPPASWQSQAEAAAGSEAVSRLSYISAPSDDRDEPFEEAEQKFNAALFAAEDTYKSLEQWFTETEAELASLRNGYAESARRYELAASALGSHTTLDEAAKHKSAELSEAVDVELKLWLEQFGEGMTPGLARDTLAEYERRDNAAHDLRSRLERSVGFIEETTRLISENEKLAGAAQLEAAELSVKLDNQRQQLAEITRKLTEWTGGEPAAELLAAAERELGNMRARLKQLKEENEAAQAALGIAAEERSASTEAESSASVRCSEAGAALQTALEQSPFASADEASGLKPLLARQEALAGEIARHRESEQQLAAQIELLRDQLMGRTVTDEEWEQCKASLEQTRSANDSSLQTAAKAERDLEELKTKQERWQRLEAKRAEMEQLCGRMKLLQTVFRGNAFVEYVAEEQLVQVCRAASERLGFLTKRRYALEVDSGGGFVIRDDANGGIRRPVSTLSGGETFLASLALALALSGQIQLRGKYPLQFFFLDEGFGTLDPELLETVITALEKLHNDTLAVGVISHVPELRARLPRRLIVTASEPSGRGSRVELETM